MDAWHDFFVAMAGAAVAFAGLVLVSVSINLERIIKRPSLVVRSAGPLIILFFLFIASSIMLIPDQRVRLYGYELVVLAVVFSIVTGTVLRRQGQDARQAVQAGLAPGNSFRLRAACCAITAVAMLMAGVMLALGNEKGAFFLVPAIVSGFLVSFVEAWVLLIEIDR